MMLRKDGEYVIYVLQHKYQKKGEWSHSGDAPSFVENIPAKMRYTGSRGRWTGTREPYNQFTACGDVWQQTGIYGSYDAKAAEKFMVTVAKYNREHTFRILKVEITQHSKETGTASFT